MKGASAKHGSAEAAAGESNAATLDVFTATLTSMTPYLVLQSAIRAMGRG